MVRDSGPGNYSQYLESGSSNNSYKCGSYMAELDHHAVFIHLAFLVPLPVEFVSHKNVQYEVVE
jgi:hypothetical protein